MRTYKIKWLLFSFSIRCTRASHTIHTETPDARNQCAFLGSIHLTMRTGKRQGLRTDRSTSVTATDSWNGRGQGDPTAPHDVYVGETNDLADSDLELLIQEIKLFTYLFTLLSLYIHRRYWYVFVSILAISSGGFRGLRAVGRGRVLSWMCWWLKTCQVYCIHGVAV